MDGKKQIRLDFTQGDVEEECIDLSLARTPASAIFLIMHRGLKETKQDVMALIAGYEQMEEGDAKKTLGLQLEVAKSSFNLGVKFVKELERVLNELENEPKKVIIYKPNWGGNTEA